MTSDLDKHSKKRENVHSLNTAATLDVAVIVSSTNAISASVDQTIAEVRRARRDVRDAVDRIRKLGLD